MVRKPELSVYLDNMKKLIVILLILISQKGYGQDPLFSQSDLNLIYMNPSFAGLYPNDRILIHRRDQWRGISAEQFNTNYLELNFHLPSKSKRKMNGQETSLAMGVHLISDMENTVFKSNELGASLSVKVGKKDKMVFVGALQVNIISGSLNSNNLIFTDQINYYNSLIGPINQENIPSLNSYLVPSFGGGFITSFSYPRSQIKRTTGGVSILNLAETKSFNNSQNYKNPKRIYIHFDHTEPIKNVYNRQLIDQVKIFAQLSRHITGFDYLTEIANRTEFGFTVPVKFKDNRLIGGFMYRNSSVFNGEYMSESLVWIVRFRPSKSNFSINYSYDHNISRLGSNSAGMTHEMGIIWILKKRKNVLCPAIDPMF